MLFPLPNFLNRNRLGLNTSKDNSPEIKVRGKGNIINQTVSKGQEQLGSKGRNQQVSAAIEGGYVRNSHIFNVRITNPPGPAIRHLGMDNSSISDIEINYDQRRSSSS